ncbi:MAG TPA: HAMP domain-containing sensor histidine kinase [Anaerohalosphaeraceae bacterium]|nr:HAMP domain-containing sensor histidine kinase [Anaerohalosphaeraceae bacterium]
MEQDILAHLLENRKSLHHQIAHFENQCLKLEEQLTQLQPLANLGMAWAMTAHELNNLLTPVINYTQLAMQNPQDAALLDKTLEKTLYLTKQAVQILEKVMLLAGAGRQENKKCLLTSLLDDVFGCLGRDFSKDKITVVRHVPEALFIYGDVDALRQVMMNLILNAHQAMREKGGVLTIAADDGAEFIRIEITDTGCGIKPDDLQRLFTPFYTSGKKNGNGLGLAFCRKIIEMHGGCIAADSVLGQGSRFRILLPKQRS